MRRVLVANRGAVAARVIRALEALAIESVAVYSDADSGAPYLEEATTAVRLGPAPAAQSYLDIDAVVGAMRSSGADGLHPGYGFLAENAELAKRVVSAGAVWIGPHQAWIERMGHKTRARDFARHLGLPMGAASEVLPAANPTAVVAAGMAVGFPVLVKPAAGGGGIGMVPASGPEELLVAVERASSMAQRGFGTGDVYLERLVERPRHIEFQLLADRHGQARHLFERDCSVQRRHQKILEEAPAPGIDREVLDEMGGQLATTLGDAGYDNIGTVEFLYDPSEGLRFLEMNTRLQVEHAVTEEVTGVDIVAAQVRVAGGEPLASILPPAIERRGHAVEARVYAEDPVRFLPSPGRLDVFRTPTGARVETGYREGQEVTPYYDPLLAKVITHGETRSQAIDRLEAALVEFEIQGVRNSIPALLTLLRSDQFRTGQVHTGLTNEIIDANGGTNR